MIDDGRAFLDVFRDAPHLKRRLSSRSTAVILTAMLIPSLAWCVVLYDAQVLRTPMFTIVFALLADCAFRLTALSRYVFDGKALFVGALTGAALSPSTPPPAAIFAGIMVGVFSSSRLSGIGSCSAGIALTYLAYPASRFIAPVVAPPIFLGLAWLSATGGPIGAVSLFVCLPALVILIAMRLIRRLAVFVFIAVFLLLTYAFKGIEFFSSAPFLPLAANVAFYAVFMTSTHFSAAPYTGVGSMVYAAALGSLAFLFGPLLGVSGGVFFAGLAAGFLVPLINATIRPKPFSLHMKGEEPFNAQG